MRKINLFLLIQLIVFSLSAQNLTYQVSDFSNDLKANFVTGEADENYYYLLRMQKEKDGSVGFLDIVEKSTMKLKNSGMIDVPSNAKEIKLKDFKVKGDFVFILFDYEIESDKLMHTAMYIYDKNGKATGKEMDLGTAGPKPSKGKTFLTIELFFNPRTEKYTILTFQNLQLYSAGVALSEQEASIRVLNKEAKLIEEKKLTFDFYASGIEKLAMDSNGNIFLLFEGISRYDNVYYKLKKGVIHPRTIATINGASGNITYSYPSIESKKKIELMELGFYQGSAGNIFLAGLYQLPSTADGHSCGIYVATFDQSTGSLTQEYSSAYTVHPENKKKTNFEIMLYGIRNVHVCADNSMKFILGENYVQDGMELRSGKVLEIRTNTSYEITSMNYGIHSQGVNGDMDEYAYTTELSTDNDTYFIYNDTDENLAEDNLDRMRFIRWTDLLNTAKPCYSHFDKNGTVSRKKFINEIKPHNQVIILTNQAIRSGNSELIVPVRLSDRVSLMRISII
jgi:hypothetical protein